MWRSETDMLTVIGDWLRAGLDRGDRASSAVVDKTAIVCALTVGLCYFAAARLGLRLLAQPESVAVFWPASGIAAGALILVGQRGRLPIALGVFAATIPANLLGDRNVVLAVAFGLCNAGEALLFAWMIERRFGSSFRFVNLRAALWFFTAACVSTAVMAVLAAATIALAGQSSASLLAMWQAWWASDAIGIIMFAPFLITLGEVIRDPPSRNELLEGAAVLGILVLVTGFTYFITPDQAEAAWWLPVPVAAIFPLLLWVGARCRPVFLAAGIALVALMIVWATTNGLGHFGNPSVALDDRVFAARITLISIAFCGLMIVAVFTERRSVEAVLRANEERFARLAASAPGIICSFRIDKDGRKWMPYASPAIGPIVSLSLDEVRADAEAFFRLIDSEDVGRFEAAIAASHRALAPLRVEFRYRHPSRGQIWLEFHSTPVHEPDGAVVWHGFLQDITWRKDVEAHVKLLMGELNHRAKNLLAVVQAVAFHTAREEDPRQFVDTFGKRIVGLAASHDLLTESAWEGVGVADLVHSQLAHFGNLIGSRINLEGPLIKLKPAAAQTIGMALHELATNAGKYGALANDEGSVRIAWASCPTFRISWTEIGGPMAAPPPKRGFGHRVMVELTEHQLDATVRLEYPSSGLVWELVAPVERTLEDGGSRFAA